MIAVSLRVVVINEAIDNVITAIGKWHVSNNFFMYRGRRDVDVTERPVRLAVLVPRVELGVERWCVEVP